MASLIARFPAHGFLPVRHGDVILSEEIPEAITALMPYRGQSRALSAAMKAAHGVAFPGPNRSTQKLPAQAVWTGMDQAFLIGVPADATLSTHAALVDQGDAWAVLTLDGAGVEDVLARLTPLDLRMSVFKHSHAARSLLGHMNAVFIRDGTRRFTIMVFRSMAKTACRELEEAMRGVAARQAR
ncbi:MAG: sarcosine oxidase subunit gamma [Rhodobacteraceae bacterium]|nr:sarcosine oxidase subunit gamma [Paracoccaceae bacterium]